MKKLLLSAIVLSLFVLPSTAAFAQGTFEAFTVGSLGSETGKSSFELSETPYLYVRIRTGGNKTINSFWENPAGTTTYTANASGTGQKYWLQLTNWNTVKAIGDWDIDISGLATTGGGSTPFSGSTSFTVTPEPLSMILFAVGGSPIAMSLYKKRKKSIV